MQAVSRCSASAWYRGYWVLSTLGGGGGRGGGVGERQVWRLASISQDEISPGESLDLVLRSGAPVLWRCTKQHRDVINLGVDYNSPVSCFMMAG